MGALKAKENNSDTYAMKENQLNGQNVKYKLRGADFLGIFIPFMTLLPFRECLRNLDCQSVDHDIQFFLRSLSSTK